MTKFVIVNIQLLPKATGIEEVGTIGYKKLFAKLKEKNAEAKKNKQLAKIHFLLGKDLFLGPKTFHVKETYVYGEFSRYRTTDQVTVLNNDKQVFKNSPGNTAASHVNEMPYVFDAKIHHLCIEHFGIKSEVFIQAFHHLLKDVARSEFPDHQLTVTTLNKKDGFDEIVSTASAYKTVSVSLTFKNGENESQDLLRQLKATKTKALKISASGGDGKMNALPDIIKEAADATFEGTGNVQLSYYDANGKLQQYNAKDNPVTFQKNRMADDDDVHFFRKVHAALLDIVDSIAKTRKGAEQ